MKLEEILLKFAIAYIGKDGWRRSKEAGILEKKIKEKFGGDLINKIYFYGYEVVVIKIPWDSKKGILRKEFYLPTKRLVGRVCIDDNYLRIEYHFLEIPIWNYGLIKEYERVREEFLTYLKNILKLIV